MKVIIIGGVAGGASAAARLRRLDEQAEITIYERGALISYANCGLPYYIGGVIDARSALVLQTPESFDKRFRVKVHTRCEAMQIEPEAKRVLIKNLETGDEFYDNYDKLLLSPGAKPIVPKIDGLNGERVFTLRTVPDADKILKFVTERQPKTAVVVGGGYIGLETAENLMRRGIDVTVVEQKNHVLQPFDTDIAADIQNYLREKGLKIKLNSALVSVRSTDNGLKLTLADNAEIDADLLIVSVGVQPDTAFLAGAVARTARGHIAVDAGMRTSAKDVFAVGDAVEVEDFVLKTPVGVPLAGPANRQGRIAANQMAGIADEYKGTQGTSVLKLFEAAAAAVGASEERLKSAGVAYQKVCLWAASHATYYPGASNVSIKLLFDGKNGKLYGAQLFGKEGVDKRADVLATAMRAGLSAFDLADLELSYAPPYGSARDPVNVLGFMAENVLTGKVEQFFTEDLKALEGMGGITRLDVRTPAETRRGSIPGTDCFIPLDELRARISELDPAKTIYVNCQSGLRSYVACRILTGNGFRCKNLAGGYRLYASIENNRFYDKETHPCGMEK